MKIHNTSPVNFQARIIASQAMKNHISERYCEKDIKALGEVIDKFEKAPDRTLHLDFSKHPTFSNFTIELYQEGCKYDTRVQYVSEGGDYASNFISWLNGIAEQEGYGETLYSRLFKNAPENTPTRNNSLNNLFNKLS